MELLAYLTIVSIVIVLLTSTLTFAVKSYDKINGQGAIYTEANYIMSTLISQVNAFNPEFIRSCKVDGNDIENCIELVIDKKRIINPDLGIIEEVPPTESGDKVVRIRIDDVEDDDKIYNIYIGNMKINNSNYAIEGFNIVKIDGEENIEQNLTYDCNEENIDICQNFTLSIRLSIYKINRNGERISKTFTFQNRFSS